MQQLSRSVLRKAPHLRSGTHTMTMQWKKWVSVAALALGVSWLAWGQTNTQQTNSQQVPDAPSTTKEKTNPFPADAPKGPPPPARPDQTAPVDVNQPPVNTPKP